MDTSAESNTSKPSVNSLPQETVDFARRIFEAAREGNSELVLAAVDAGLPPNLTNEKGTILSKPTDEVVTLTGGNRFYAGNTLLMLAAYAGHTDLTKSLLEKGSDPNRTNDLGQSIVAGAVFKGHNDIVRALIEKGADPRQGTPNAIQAAHMFRRTELVEVLGTRDEDLVDFPAPLPAGTPTTS